MKIIVTGGAGFIGSHLCEKLLNGGDEVICIDNLFTGKETNIAHLINNPAFKFIMCDIIEPIDIVADQIYNLACPASPIHYKHDPVKTIKTNVIGMANVLENAKTTGARVLQASTSEVYGDPEIHPQHEEYVGHVNQLGVRACYDEGKRCAETLCYDYKRQYDVDVRVARIFNTYGTNMHSSDGRVVSNFIVAMLNNKPITIYGDGNQTRSFCYVSDVVEGLILLMNSTNERAKTAPINIGNPVEITIGELATAINEIISSEKMIAFEPLTQDDPIKRQPDITVAKEILRWEPKINLEHGLLKTVKWFKNE